MSSSFNAPAGAGRSPAAAAAPVSAARTGPRTRTLVWLALGMLVVHGLVLRTEPAHLGPTLTPAATGTTAFATRSILTAPAAVAAEGAVVSATPPAVPAATTPPRPKRPPKPVLKQKAPETPYPSALPAIDSIADSALEAPAPEPTAADADAATDSSSAATAQDNGLADNGDRPDRSGPTDTAAARLAAASATAAASVPASSASSAAAAEGPAPPAGLRQTVTTTVQLPDSARLAYKVTGNAKGLTYHASAELNWRHTRSDYDARMTVSALFLGARSMSSSGRIVGEGLAPTRFADKYKSEVAAHFEPDKGQVSFSANTPAVPWLQGMQDRVSVFFQLAGMLAGQPENFPVGSVISMVTVGPRDADGWSFLVESAEKISLPAGDMDTLKLARQPRKEFDQKVEIWYAPSLGYLPVRSKITQANGDFVDQQLLSVGPPAP